MKERPSVLGGLSFFEKGELKMAAIDYSAIPESVRQRLLAATYEMAQRLFQDPTMQAEYEAWLERKRKSDNESR